MYKKEKLICNYISEFETITVESLNYSIILLVAHGTAVTEQHSTS
jgi:hypothetical protein